MEVFIVLFILFVAHCIGDFPLQSSYLTVTKSESKYLLFVHATIVTACITFAFGLLSVLGLLRHLTVADYLIIIAINGVSHFVIDYLKCEISKSPAFKNDFGMLYIDQACHVAILGLSIYVLCL